MAFQGAALRTPRAPRAAARGPRPTPIMPPFPKSLKNTIKLPPVVPQQPQDRPDDGRSTPPSPPPALSTSKASPFPKRSDERYRHAALPRRPSHPQRSTLWPRPTRPRITAGVRRRLAAVANGHAARPDAFPIHGPGRRPAPFRVARRRRVQEGFQLPRRPSSKTAVPLLGRPWRCCLPTSRRISARASRSSPILGKERLQ